MHAVVTHPVAADLVIELDDCATNYHHRKCQLSQIEKTKRAEPVRFTPHVQITFLMHQLDLIQTNGE